MELERRLFRSERKKYVSEQDFSGIPDFVGGRNGLVDAAQDPRPNTAS